MPITINNLKNTNIVNICYISFFFFGYKGEKSPEIQLNSTYFKPEDFSKILHKDTQKLSGRMLQIVGFERKNIGQVGQEICTIIPFAINMLDHDVPIFHQPKLNSQCQVRIRVGGDLLLVEGTIQKLNSKGIINFQDHMT